MKTFIRCVKLLTPVLAVMSIGSGCQREECCTWTDDAGDTYSYCENDGQWNQYYYSWTEVKFYSRSYGGTCTRGGLFR